MRTGVIVVGAGPTGLMLAAELRLAGVPAVLLDQATQRSRQSRAGGIQPRTAEVFDLRGLLAPMLAAHGGTTGTGGHFAGLPVPLDCRPFNTRHPYPVRIPQYDLERFLEGRLEPGAVRTGHRLVALRQDGDGVTATVAGPGGEHELTAAYLVGCDGAHSAVRKLTGIPFPGRAGRYRMAATDITLAGPGVAELPGIGHFSSYVRRSGAAGPGILAPLGGGAYRFLFGGPEQQELPRDAPVTADEVARALRAAYADRIRLVELRHASRFSDASRQAQRYRDGRVLLAGDAAHIHLPAGGQGINLGVQDAVNLGWKLAASLTGRAPAGLLDSYHTERHPVAARVLANTRAQAVLMAPGDEDAGPLRDLMTELLRLPDTNRHLSGMISGLDTRYPVDGTGHPLLGARLPDVALKTATGPTRLSALLHAGRGVLLDLGADPAVGATAARWSDRVDVVGAAVLPDDELPDLTDLGATALLVRPDGHACWTDADPDPEPALRRWFGAPVG
jgi:2-polyprenyl-6-methoxyphenol hydroxylase-like FAD-dependent oxidoreductase